MKTLSKRRRLVRTVDLRFFRDDANGEYGLAHAETLNGTNGNEGFNAFWDGGGFFHDVFEHAHEFTDPHFRGDCAMNIGGEMAAMGALHYYVNELNMNNRFRSGGWVDASQAVIDNTFGMIQEIIGGNGGSFSDPLTCGVPPQKETDNSELEYIIDAYAEKVAALVVEVEEPKELVLGEEPESYERDFKASCTREKITNLHRYGYRMAAKLVPYSGANHSTITHFKDFWNTFCRANNAEEMAALYQGVTFKLYQDSENVLSWVAEFQIDRHLPTEDRPERIRFDSRTLSN